MNYHNARVCVSVDRRSIHGHTSARSGFVSTRVERHPVAQLVSSLLANRAFVSSGRNATNVRLAFLTFARRRRRSKEGALVRREVELALASHSFSKSYLFDPFEEKRGSTRLDPDEAASSGSSMGWRNVLPTQDVLSCFRFPFLCQQEHGEDVVRSSFRRLPKKKPTDTRWFYRRNNETVRFKMHLSSSCAS